VKRHRVLAPRQAEREEDDHEGGEGGEDARPAAEDPRHGHDRHRDPDRLLAERPGRPPALELRLDAPVDLPVDALEEARDQVLLVLRAELLPRLDRGLELLL